MSALLGARPEAELPLFASKKRYQLRRRVHQGAIQLPQRREMQLNLTMAIDEAPVNPALSGFQGCAAKRNGVEPQIPTTSEKSHDPLAIVGKSGRDLPEFP